MSKINTKIKKAIEIGSQEIGNTCLSGCCPANCVSSYKLGKEIAVDMIPTVERLMTSARDLNIANKLPPKSIEEMPPVETVGLDLMVDKVWKCLQLENVGIIGLFGMGGAGKTTLMTRVHNEFRKREHKFDLILWVVVSKDCNISNLMDMIGSRLGIKDDGDWNRSSEDRRRAKIYQILKHKRFVLMLDDVWGKLEIGKLGVPSPEDTNYESKVVFTTRFEDVCAKMQADEKLKVECLHEKEAFELFCKHVGKDTLNSHPKIGELAREMVKECGRLPLALITVGSAMAGVNNVGAWQQAIDDLGASPWTGPDLENKVFNILKFSYDKLPDETHKNCFLYCSLYPEDYEIDVEGLIDRWIGEGFLGKGKYQSKRGIFEMREEGQSVIEKLKLSCLLEDATNWNYGVEMIKMHDVIRDMALWLWRDEDKNKEKVVVENEAFRIIEPEKLNIVERISVIQASIEGPWNIPTCPNLLTLCLDNASNGFSNFQSMTRLKVLDLATGWPLRYIPIEIGMLINLEFLNVGGEWISMLEIELKMPVELKNLKKLRVLLGYGVGIPSGVLASLERLQVLRLTLTEENGDILLKELECLPVLEELCVKLNNISCMQQIRDSPKLCSCLRVFSLDNIKEPIVMLSLLEVPATFHTSGQYYLGKLRQVFIRDCQSITHLTWLKYAPLLEILSVIDCDSMEEVVKEDQDEEHELEAIQLFLCIRVLNFINLPKLKSIYNRALPFPSLRTIRIGRCDSLRKLPLNSNSAKETLLQIKGDSTWWSNLVWEDPPSERLLSKFSPF
ncbi:hypothetical protein PIB30_022766 [Stylosanthes scabra]|uniref:NB-ARC domain-containing protein n=1 Tax=Stylosanthes scabra TaxID=79078 RepID=A0ABU6S9J8_9FABA|nr:hypothetical protein [Stylosanthes scabra]